jgi:hypothetical protein
VYCVWQVVKTSTVISNNPVFCKSIVTFLVKWPYSVFAVEAQVYSYGRPCAFCELYSCGFYVREVLGYVNPNVHCPMPYYGFLLPVVTPKPLKVNSHVPCRTPAILQQCHGLCESPCGSQKYPNCYSYGLTDWYVPDNNLRGTLRCSGKKLNVGRSPICRLQADDANSHMPCHANAVPCHGLPSRFHNSVVLAWLV